MEGQFHLNNSTAGNDMHSLNHRNGKLAAPLHLQRLEKALRVDLLLRQVESYVDDSDYMDGQDPLLVSGLTKQQLRSFKTRAYNLGKVKKSKKWIKQILIEKSDSSDTDFQDDFDFDMFGNNYSMTEEDEETIEDMMKFANMKKHIKRGMIGEDDDLFGDVRIQPHPYKTYTSSVLSSTLPKTIAHLQPNMIKDSGMIKTTPEGPKPKKPRTNNKSTKQRKTSTTSSMSAPAAPKTLTLGEISVLPVVSTSTVTTSAPSAAVVTLSSIFNEDPIPITLPVGTGMIQRSRSLDAGSSANLLPDSISITAISSPTTMASSFSLPLTAMPLVENDPMKKFRLLDEIPYDMTLPDEILQSESGDESPSGFSDVVSSNRLPEEAAETDESNNSLLSQSLSSPPSVVHTIPSKAATAPSTPTGLSASAKQLSQISAGLVQKKSGSSSSTCSQNRTKAVRKPVKLLPTTTPVSVQISISTPATPTSVSSSASSVMTREMMMSAKRKRHWMNIAKKGFIKSHGKVTARRATGLDHCRTVSKNCKNGWAVVYKKWAAKLAKEIKNTEPGKPVSEQMQLRKDMMSFWLGSKWMQSIPKEVIKVEIRKIRPTEVRVVKPVKQQDQCIIDLDDNHSIPSPMASCLPDSFTLSSPSCRVFSPKSDVKKRIF